MIYSVKYVLQHYGRLIHGYFFLAQHGFVNTFLVRKYGLHVFETFILTVWKVFFSSKKGGQRLEVGHTG